MLVTAMCRFDTELLPLEQAYYSKRMGQGQERLLNVSADAKVKWSNMDSDSSLDGELETKHEIAVKSLRNSASSPSEVYQTLKGYESEGSEVSDRSVSPVSSQIQSPPTEEKGELSPCSNDGELSDSSNDNDYDNNDNGDNEDEARSNASSTSSKQFSSEVTTKLQIQTDKDSEVCNKEPCIESPNHYQAAIKKDEIQGHGEDLSDVSDLDSNDPQDSLDAVSEEERSKDMSKNDKGVNKRKEREAVEEMEQLDFEAEEQQEKDEKEEGECEGKDEKSDDEGELKGDDLEEGELTDEDENRPEETEPRPVCRFYNRGQCTWGSSCRFVHPGVTDKGNYTMFDMVRPLVPVNGPPTYPPADYRPYDKSLVMGMPYPGPRKEEPIVFESAWERGLRQAKEMMRKSSKRKETDMDFEEKKMNLSLGQEELDKENDYYTRPATPLYKDDERWGLKLDAERYHREGSAALERYEDLPGSPYYHHHHHHHPRGGGGAGGGGGGGGSGAGGGASGGGGGGSGGGGGGGSGGVGSEYWRRVHYEPGESRALRVEAEYTSSNRERGSGKYHTSHQHRQAPQELYDKYEKKSSSRQKSHPTREVIVERTEKPWRDERYAEVSMPSRRGDEWADPWMRSKSPSGRKGTSRPSRRQSYSSGSSYSSSNSSRSSSQSSHSSYSHDSHSRSRSKSRSVSPSASRSSSRTPLSHARRKTNRPLVPTARAAETSPTSLLTSPRKASKQLGEPRGFGKTKPLTSSLIQSEKKAASERALLMNPPAPSPRKQKEVRPPSPAMMRKSAQNPPPPPPPQPPQPVSSSRRSKSSHSSSGSDSSGSSSDSSESSCSSSSSSREPSPKVVCPPKRIVIDERERLALAQSLKVKAMDALKLSGQKQQIKLTLKAPGMNSNQNKAKNITGLPELPELNLVRRDRVPAPLPQIVGKKRTAENSASAESSIAAKMAALSKPAQKKATSRREELLKQLKAVEDAIARKRSKI